MQVISPITHSKSVKHVKSIETSRIISLYDKIGFDVKKYFVGMGKIDIYECDDTKLRFFYPNTIAGDAGFYEQLDKKANNYYSLWKWEHEISINYVKETSKVLEIGCAYGTFLQACKDKGVKESTGLELNRNAVNTAISNGLDVRNELVEDHLKSHNEYYDLVGSFQVVEHISDLKSFIDNSVSCLKKSGIYIISVPNNECYFFKNDIDHTLNLPPHHMGLWTEESLINIAPYFGLEVIKVYKEPAKKSNYGIYYEVFLRKKLGMSGSFLKTFYKISRPFVKVLMNLYPPKYGACITVVYRKIN